MHPKSLCCEKQPMQSVWAVEWAWGWDYAVPVARRLHGFSVFLIIRVDQSAVCFGSSANKLHVGALRGRAASVFWNIIPTPVPPPRDRGERAWCWILLTSSCLRTCRHTCTNGTLVSPLILLQSLFGSQTLLPAACSSSYCIIFLHFSFSKMCTGILCSAWISCCCAITVVLPTGRAV